MKKTVLIVLTLVTLMGLIAGTSIVAGASGDSPKLEAANPVTEMGEIVVFLGSGFEPGQEVNLVLSTPDGYKIDIAYALDGETSPVANEIGAFVTSWEPGRIASRVMASGRGGYGDGAYIITATDTDYVTLATAVMAFYEADDEMPRWAQ